MRTLFNMTDFSNEEKEKKLPKQVRIPFTSRDKSKLYNIFKDVSSYYLNRTNVFVNEKEELEIFQNSVDIFNYYLSEMTTNPNPSIQDDKILEIILKETKDKKLKIKYNTLHNECFEYNGKLAENIKKLLLDDYKTAVKYSTIGFIQTSIRTNN